MIFNTKIKKLTNSLILLSGIVIFSGASQAAIIASSESEVSVGWSTEFELGPGVIENGKAIFDQNEDSSSTGTTSVFSDQDVNSGTFSALASAEINDSIGYAEAFMESDGFITITNENAFLITGGITFTVDMFTSLFTGSMEEGAIGFVSLVIEAIMPNGDSIIIYDDFIEDITELTDPDLARTITLRDSLVFDFSLEADDSIEFNLELGASGFAESQRQAVVSASAPSASLVLLSAGLVLIAFRRLKPT